MASLTKKQRAAIKRAPRAQRRKLAASYLRQNIRGGRMPRGKNGPRLASIVQNVGRAPRRAFGGIAALTAMLVSMLFPQHTSRYLVPPDRILHCPYNHSNHHRRPTHVIWNLLTTTWWVRGSFCGQRMVQSYGLRSERFGHCD